MTQHLDEYRCSTEVRGSFQETAPRKTAEHTVKHRDGGVGSVVANHRGVGESLVVVTRLPPWARSVSASKSWGINGHTTRCSSPASVAVQFT